jgi:WD40 repeat protein
VKLLGSTDRAASLSPDGKLFAAASETTIGLWDIASGRLKRTLGKDGYYTARWSPDGRLIAAFTAKYPRRVEVFDLASGERLFSIDPGRLPMSQLAFSPDSKTLLVGGWAAHQNLPLTDNRISLLDARTGVERRRIDTGDRNPIRIVPSPDGSRIAAVCVSGRAKEGAIYIWDAKSGKELLTILPPDSNVMPRGPHFTNLAFTPSGKSFVTTGGMSELVEWDVETGKEVRRFGHGALAGNDLAFSPDGKTVALAGPGAAVRLYDRDSGEERLAADGNSMQIDDVAVTPDGKTVVTSGLGPTVLFWDPATGGVKHRPEPRESDAWYYCPSRDGKVGIATDSAGKALRVIDLHSGAPRRRIPLDFLGDAVSTAAVSRGGELVAVRGFADEALSVVDTASGAVVRTFKDPKLQGCKARFTDDRQTLFIFRADYQAEVWDLPGGKKLRQFSLPTGADPGNPAPVRRAPVLPAGTVAVAPFNVVLSADGSRIALTGPNGQFFFLDGRTGEEVSRFQTTASGPFLMAFSTDGHMLARVGWNNPVVYLLEVASGKERRGFTGHRGDVYALAFAPDDSFLVSGGLDTTAVVWDLTARLTPGVPRDVSPVAYDPDGRWAALAGEDAEAAFKAVQDFAADPERAVAYFGERLKPVLAADAKLVAGLIVDLDSDQFTTREQAARRLENLGERVESACRKALAATPSAEVRRRMAEIVEKQDRKWRKPAGDEIRSLRALEALERAGTPEARRVLQSLAAGVPEARLTAEAAAALARLAGRSAAGSGAANR